jgi:hypothetical protein
MLSEVMPEQHQLNGVHFWACLASEVLLCFPFVRFHVFSPYRAGRYCGASKPGKEKQKSYDYRSAILMVHRFRSSVVVFTQVVRKIEREVTRKSDGPTVAQGSRQPLRDSDHLAATNALSL